MACIETRHNELPSCEVSCPEVHRKCLSTWIHIGSRFRRIRSNVKMKSVVDFRTECKILKEPNLEMPISFDDNSTSRMRGKRWSDNLSSSRAVSRQRWGFYLIWLIVNSGIIVSPSPQLLSMVIEDTAAYLSFFSLVRRRIGDISFHLDSIKLQPVYWWQYGRPCRRDNMLCSRHDDVVESVVVLRQRRLSLHQCQWVLWCDTTIPPWHNINRRMILIIWLLYKKYY